MIQCRYALVGRSSRIVTDRTQFASSNATGVSTAITARRTAYLMALLGLRTHPAGSQQPQWRPTRLSRPGRPMKAGQLPRPSKASPPPERRATSHSRRNRRGEGTKRISPSSARSRVSSASKRHHTPIISNSLSRGRWAARLATNSPSLFAVPITKPCTDMATDARGRHTFRYRRCLSRANCGRQARRTLLRARACENVRASELATGAQQ